MENFLLVISLWGYNGLNWEYIGNQYVYNIPMSEIQCDSIVDESSWTRWENNKLYRLSVECVQKDS